MWMFTVRMPIQQEYSTRQLNVAKSSYTAYYTISFYMGDYTPCAATKTVLYRRVYVFSQKGKSYVI